MKHALVAILLTLPILGFVTDQPAQACACCSRPNTFSSAPEASSLSFAPGVAFTGALIDVRELNPEPMIEIPEYLLSGKVAQGQLKLTLSQKGAPAGTITLRPKGQASHKLIGIDFLLPQDVQAKLDENQMIYHEITQPVSIETSPEFKKARGLSFGADATLSFHGNGNACWQPGESAGRWTLSYTLVKGRLLEHGLARGESVPPKP